VPYGGTFLVFTDYCRPAVRLSALMGQRVIYVMTHDSIGLGEDGPTHQPVEHLASLRAMPNLNVFRPCDPVETAECWELALTAGHAPSILALTRQAVPLLRTEAAGENRSAKGAYVLAEAEGGKRDVTILATGSEVGVADVCIAVCDGLKGLPDAINTAWPLATVQQCIIHLIRNVRREAPVVPIGGGRPYDVGSSQRPDEAGGSLIREAPERVGSSPDKAGTCQHCQMVRVRRARPEGAREKPAFDASLGGTGSNLADLGRDAVHVGVVTAPASARTESHRPG